MILPQVAPTRNRRREEHNAERPHSSLENQTPKEFAKKFSG
jgi:hypothetical protein